MVKIVVRCSEVVRRNSVLLKLRTRCAVL